jgi:hypothetical protein
MWWSKGGRPSLTSKVSDPLYRFHCIALRQEGIPERPMYRKRVGTQFCGPHQRRDGLSVILLPHECVA